MLEGLTSRVIRAWLRIEKVALGMLGRQVMLDRLYDNDNDNHSHKKTIRMTRLKNRHQQWDDSVNTSTIVTPLNNIDGRHENSESSEHDDSCPLTATLEESSSLSSSSSSASDTPTLLRRGENEDDNSRYRRYIQNIGSLILVVALIGFYAFVHVYIIQTEHRVFITTWFFEWFMIPVLLTFSFCAPLHEAMGVGNCNTRCNSSTNATGNDGTHGSFRTEEDVSVCTRQQRSLHVRRDQYLHRIRLLQRDPATQRLVLTVLVCYAVYVAGDACFFIPLGPPDTHVVTCILYLLAVLTNMAFIYHGFFLSILTMRVMVVRLHELEHSVDTTLRGQTLASAAPRSWNATAPGDGGYAYHHSPRSASTTLQDVPRERVLDWVQQFQELRDDMQLLSNHLGVRMAVGITMFVVEASNMILNVWEAVGSTLTRQQTVLLLLMYAANATMLIMTTFQAAYTVTLCTERIGPSIALLSLRTPHSPDRAAELNVLAQTCMQAPIRLRVGNFHITGDYANALTAWFFGLFLVVFGMKLPTI